MTTPLQEFAKAVMDELRLLPGVGQKSQQRLLNTPGHPFDGTTVTDLAHAVWNRLFAPKTPGEKIPDASKERLLKKLAQLSASSPQDLPTIIGFTKAITTLAEQSAGPASKNGGSRGKKSASGGRKLFEPFTAHLAAVARECRDVVLRGIPLSSDADNIALPLASVYVQLETATPRPAPAGEAARLLAGGNLSALEALFDEEQQRVVLVGDPGSGKSTFLQYVTLWLAAPLSGLQGRKLPTADLEPPALLRDRPLLPLRIILREFAHALEDCAAGCSEDVVQFLTQRLAKASHKPAADALPQLLRSGHALVLFDGLDEVPARLLPRVRRAISSFAGGEHQASRVVVTCRKHSYRRDEFRLPDFSKEHEIAPLGTPLQATFVRGWYQALGEARPELKPECTACAASLLEAIRNDPSDRLKEMAGNPFFLTAMAGLHRPDRPLPNTGSALMNLLLDSLLRESRRTGQDLDDGTKAAEPELASLLRGLPKGFDDLRKCLEEVAFEARARRSRGAAGGRSAKQQDKEDSFWLDGDLLENRLGKIAPGRVAAADLITALWHRAGILQSEGGERFAFTYRFEEFLAGCHIAKPNTGQAGRPPQFHSRVLALLQEQGDYARNPVIWAAGYHAHVASGAEHAVTALVKLLVARSNEAAAAERLQLLGLAADIAKDAGMAGWSEVTDPHAADTVKALRAALMAVRDGGAKFDIKARAEAASALGRLGDDRPGVGTRPRPTGSSPAERPDFLWCGPDPKRPGKPFPAGHFLMGGDPEAYSSSKAPFPCTRIGQPFLVAKYPVTVAQYRLFVQAKGYANDTFWTTEGQKWRDGQADTSQWPEWMKPIKEAYERTPKPIAGPEDYGPAFQTPNHPRVCVSWFEALAFCRWLNATFATEELGLPEGWVVALPTDAQWERAARWPNDLEAKQIRRFPWGDEHADEDLSRRCNWRGTGLGQTSAVGLFSTAGDSAGGLADLAGNVLEWCLSRPVMFDTQAAQAAYNASKSLDAEETGKNVPKEANFRVLRGGSWYDVADFGRAAYRCWLNPGSRYVLVGFRVVASPCPLNSAPSGL